MIVDLHSHYFPLDAVRDLADGPLPAGERPDDSVHLSVGGHDLTLSPQLVRLDRQLADLHRQGLARRALQVPPFTALYELPPALGVEWSRRLNDGIAAAA